MNSVPQIHLVDRDGFGVPVTERFDGPEPDPTDPNDWPAWTDKWNWELDDLADVAELEAAEVDCLATLSDVPLTRPPSSSFSTAEKLAANGSSPVFSCGATSSFICSA